MHDAELMHAGKFPIELVAELFNLAIALLENFGPVAAAIGSAIKRNLKFKFTLTTSLTGVLGFWGKQSGS